MRNFSKTKHKSYRRVPRYTNQWFNRRNSNWYEGDVCRNIPLPPFKRVYNPSRPNNPLGQSNRLARALFVPSFSFLTRSFFSEVRSIIASHPHPPPIHPYASDVAKWDVEFYLWSFRSVSVINDSIDIIACFWYPTLSVNGILYDKLWKIKFQKILKLPE